MPDPPDSTLPTQAVWVPQCTGPQRKGSEHGAARLSALGQRALRSVGDLSAEDSPPQEQGLKIFIPGQLKGFLQPELKDFLENLLKFEGFTRYLGDYGNPMFPFSLHFLNFPRGPTQKRRKWRSRSGKHYVPQVNGTGF